MTNAPMIDATSIPPGRYMTPIVDGLDAYWARIIPDVDGVHVRRPSGWQPASESQASVAVEQIVSSLHTARQTYGRFTGVCAVCALAIDDGDSRRRGGHRACLDSAMANENVVAGRAAIRSRALAALVDTWRLAPVDRRVRMLVNAGPITLGYDCTSRCSYTLPTTLRGDQLALAQPALVDTLAALVDAQHDRECPDLRQGGEV